MKVFQVNNSLLGANGSEEKGPQGLGFKAWSMWSMVGHLNRIFASGNRNFNKPIFKWSNAQGKGGWGGGGCSSFQLINTLVTWVCPILLSVELKYVYVLKDQRFKERNCVIKSIYLWQFDLERKNDCSQRSCLLNKLLLKVVVFDARWHGFNILTRKICLTRYFQWSCSSLCLVTHLEMNIILFTFSQSHFCIYLAVQYSFIRKITLCH